MANEDISKVVDGLTESDCITPGLAKGIVEKRTRGGSIQDDTLDMEIYRHFAENGIPEGFSDIDEAREEVAREFLNRYVSGELTAAATPASQRGVEGMGPKELLEVCEGLSEEMDELSRELNGDPDAQATASAHELAGTTGGDFSEMELEAYGTGVSLSPAERDLKAHKEEHSEYYEQRERREAIASAHEASKLEAYGTGQAGNSVNEAAVEKSKQLQAAKNEYFMGKVEKSDNPEDYGTGVSNSADGSPDTRTDEEKRDSFARKLTKLARGTKAAGR